MNICGQIVKHRTFGLGKIVNFDSNYVTVLFDKSKEEKRFSYPSSFGVFLELENNVLIKQIEEDKKVFEQKEIEKKRISEEHAKLALSMKSKEDGEKWVKDTTAKASDKNNIAFKCNYCDGGSSKEAVGYRGVCSDEAIKYNINVAKHIWCSQPDNMCYKYLHGEISRDEICKFYETTKTEFSKSVCYESQMLEIWNAGAGVTQNGDDKGKPMSLRNAKANSLALLTTKLPYADDIDRFIFAAFLIDESYEGDNREEGFVRAHPKYRIQLSLDEAKKLKFWDYYYNPNKPEKIVFGSGLHRYFTDTQAAQVLKSISEIKKGKSEEELTQEFLEHYVRIKNLDVDDIPIPNGALKRSVR